MKKLHLKKLLLATNLMTVLSLLSPNFAQAIEYGGVGGKPANPIAGNSRTESIFIHTLEPGATQEDGVLVVNNSPETKTLLVYAADSTPSTDGAFACKQLTEEKTDVGAWITLKKSEVTLESGTKETVPFTIRTPLTASVGEHNGCILIQEKKAAVEGQTGAAISMRTGLRVAITIPGDILRKLEIGALTVAPTDAGFSLTPTVKNIGNVSIDANVRVITRNFIGMTHFTNGGEFPILRGDTSQWNFDLKRPFWGGFYRSTPGVEYDENPEAGVGLKSGKALTNLTGATVWFFSFPTLPALLIEILVLLFIFLGLPLIIRQIRKNRSVPSVPLA